MKRKPRPPKIPDDIRCQWEDCPLEGEDDIYPRGILDRRPTLYRFCKAHAKDVRKYFGKAVIDVTDSNS